jgi:hypothetical protein
VVRQLDGNAAGPACARGREAGSDAGRVNVELQLSIRRTSPARGPFWESSTVNSTC